MRKYVLILAAVSLLPSAPAMAQSSQFDAYGRKVAPAEQEPVTLESLLPAINKSSVLQSDRYASTRSILQRRVFDADAKAVGEIRDVRVVSGGAVSNVLVNLNRLRLNGVVAVSVQNGDLKGTAKGYQTGLNSEAIKTMHPEMLKQTDEGLGLSGSTSVQKLIGVDVVSDGGEEVGKLKEVLFDTTGSYADVAFMSISYGPFKNRPVAVPFSVTSIQENRGRPQLVVSTADLEVIFKFLSSKAK